MMIPYQRSNTMTGRAILLLILFSLGFLGCHDNGSDDSAARIPKRPVVSDEGQTITFPAGSPGLQQLSVRESIRGTVTIPVVAPARIVASILAGSSGIDKIIMFESPDITSLYSQYKQSKVSVARTSRNLERIKDMFAHQAATGKDLNDAETDAATARASMAEMEGKLRTLGFNPVELEAVSAGIVWLISDVPETELHEVQKGEDVDVRFSSFPNTIFTGRAEAVGDVVDPMTRTVKVRVALKNPGGKFMPGMFAGVDFGDPQSGVITLPLSAVVTVDGKDYAFIEVVPGQYRRRQVTLANSTAKEGIVLSGIEDGDRVVTAGAMLLKGLSFGF
jgi:cobalt-zinc-cadmium efflux system membrane fusion protein